MQSESLNVFDFDGTLIKVNSFREITKIFSATLLKKLQIVPFFALMTWYILRKTGVISHLVFKKHVVNIFEQSLKEQEKKSICQNVFDTHVNKEIFERFMNLDNCIVCTASPLAYISRICLGKKVPLICSLGSNVGLPDLTNSGLGKVKNLKAFFKDKKVKIANLYTDSNTDDRAMIDFAVNAFLVNNETVIKIK